MLSLSACIMFQTLVRAMKAVPLDLGDTWSFYESMSETVTSSIALSGYLSPRELGLALGRPDLSTGSNQ